MKRTDEDYKNQRGSARVLVCKKSTHARRRENRQESFRFINNLYIKIYDVEKNNPPALPPPRKTKARKIFILYYGMAIIQVKVYKI